MCVVSVCVLSSSSQSMITALPSIAILLINLLLWLVAVVFCALFQSYAQVHALSLLIAQAEARSTRLLDGTRIEIASLNPFPPPGNGVGPVRRRRDRRGAVDRAPEGPW